MHAGDEDEIEITDGLLITESDDKTKTTENGLVCKHLVILL